MWDLIWGKKKSWKEKNNLEMDENVVSDLSLYVLILRQFIYRPSLYFLVCLMKARVLSSNRSLLGLG